MLLQDLIQLGLKEKEARVYLAALELGVSSVQKIAKKAGVHRASAYFVLESLIKNGLISHFQQGKKRNFAATHPAQLRRLVKEQKIEIEEKEYKLEKEILPELSALHNIAGDKPRVSFYEGINGLRAMREDFLKTRDKEVEAIYPVEGYYGVFTEKENKKHRAARKKKKIHFKAIYTSSKEKKIPLKGEMATCLRVPSKSFPLSSDITLYDNKIAFAFFDKKEPCGVIIESKSVSKTIRSLFNLGWKAAKKYNPKIHNNKKGAR